MNIGLKFKICELHCFVQKTYSDIKIACDIAIYQENTSKYLISLGFLNKSYMTYLEAKRYYRENEELISVEFDNFFHTYDRLEQELKLVISTENKNPSLLHSRFDQFQQKVENINDLIKVMQNAR
ncbi:MULTISPECIES: hypothetical protein [Bacillus]|uniref:Group-specific protein n=1 Tax=Bacillus thuringiensis serovar sooncheon TaxID=180891 RepID=A0A9Q5SKZ0_BACTU|nr:MULTISPECIES: hypothetical protein [Bacillus]MDC7973008.1 hypothetical protein [Bacillus sp. BLCC-B18]OTW72570.1 hypothetical protein BK707_05595 [Bacillus thuringiensis serovar coreanensis]OTX49626.1 hypothetical protein BK724_09265 [Bacillus thuringiensis serovar sooncheon]OTX57198.1 hypothetical protein BK725_05215 [Bacillus thuringiensis serovar guiyangiensis]OTX71959.1 hypothetical protein BK727_06640 [Bacillus thuringiensis serovar roskildiensis]